MKSIDLTVLLMLFAAVTAITNIAVEVFKSFITFGSTAKLNACRVPRGARGLKFGR